jgi:MazG family protein
MIRRHPHVFSEPLTGGAAAQTVRWEEIKAEERKAKGGSVTKTRTLDDVPLPLPALVRALKLQQRAARVSFDWGNADAVFEKLTEEIGEFRAELNRPDRQAERLQDELGDMLFCMVNIARHLGIDPETALRSTNNKFRRRFNRVEDFLDEEGLTPQSSSLDHMESLWQKAKQEERS